MGLQSTHPESTVPTAFLTSLQHHQIHREVKPRHLAQRLPARLFIIQYLPICVGGHVRAWLEFLPHDSIRDWADLKRVFVENF